MESNLQKKIGNLEFQEFKKEFEKSENQINYIKENLSQFMDDRHINDDFNFLRKKFENLSTIVLNLKNEDINKNRISNESTRFVENLFFNEFRKTLQKDLDIIKEMIYSESKNLSTDMINEMKSFVKEKDLKEFEGN